MTVAAPTSRPGDLWPTLAAADPEAMPSQSPAWVAAMVATGQYEDASRVVEANGDRWLLPAVRGRGARRLSGAGSYPPAWGFGGLVGPGAGSDAAAAGLRQLWADGHVRSSIRPNPLRDPIWADAAAQVRTEGLPVVRLPRRAHVLDLDGGNDAAWNRLGRRRRRGVRTAERAGLEVVCGSSRTLLAEWYGLFERSIERWAAHAHEPVALARARARRRDPQAKLQAVVDAMGDDCRIWLARDRGEPVAGIIVLGGASVAHYTHGAMDKERASKVRANDLLMWRAIEDSIAHGSRRLHLGESGSSTTLAEFKESFGARAVDYGEYRLERIPLTRAELAARGAAKRVVGFREP